MFPLCLAYTHMHTQTNTRTTYPSISFPAVRPVLPSSQRLDSVCQANLHAFQVMANKLTKEGGREREAGRQAERKGESE